MENEQTKNLNNITNLADSNLVNEFKAENALKKLIPSKEKKEIIKIKNDRELLRIKVDEKQVKEIALQFEVSENVARKCLRENENDFLATINFFVYSKNPLPPRKEDHDFIGEFEVPDLTK